jgi:hypothetical protein
MSIYIVARATTPGNRSVCLSDRDLTRQSEDCNAKLEEVATHARARGPEKVSRHKSCWRTCLGWKTCASSGG